MVVVVVGLPLTASPPVDRCDEQKEARKGERGGTAAMRGGQREEKRKLLFIVFIFFYYVRCVSLFELADDLDVEHEISPVDVLHHVVQAVLQGVNTGRRCSQTDAQALRSESQSLFEFKKKEEREKEATLTLKRITHFRNRKRSNKTSEPTWPQTTPPGGRRQQPKSLGTFNGACLQFYGWTDEVYMVRWRAPRSGRRSRAR